MTRTVLAFAALVAAGPAVAESATSGVWTYTFEAPSAASHGFATALAPAPSPSDDPNEPRYLIARCLGGRTEFLVGGAGGWGLSGRKLDVATRIDGAAPVTAKWGVSSNGKAVFLDDKVEDFLRALPDNAKLGIAITDGTGAVHENVFATKGFAQVREKIAQACRWPK